MKSCGLHFQDAVHRAPNQVAILYGPWRLAVDQASSPNFFDEPSIQNVPELPLKHSKCVASARFAVPAACFVLHYRPGGYPVQPQTAVIGPIAEYTNGPDLNQLEWWAAGNAHGEVRKLIQRRAICGRACPYFSHRCDV